MPKLFVAIDIPADATATLVRLQPPAAPSLPGPSPGGDLKTPPFWTSIPFH